MRREYATTTAGLIAGALLSAACGGTDEPPNDEIRDPADIGVGEMGVAAGMGERRTDPIDADGDGEPDVLRPLAASFDAPLDVTVTSDGAYIVDWNGHKIRKLTDEGVEFVLGTGIEGDACEADFGEEGCTALAAQVNHPTDVTPDGDGRLLIAAWHNSKIKRYDPATNKVMDLCGSGGRNFVGDGGPCRDEDGTDLVTFDLPSSVVYDAAGGILLSDQANQVIRRIAPDGIITTVVGQCPMGGFGCPEGRGYSGDGGPATEARLANNLGQGTDPQGKIALAADGSLYIADTGNHVIRHVTPGSDGILGEGDPTEEIITTVAGTGEPGTGGGGGPATEAELSSPTDVAIAPNGSFFIADRGNSCIRRVDTDGVLSTVAGHCGEAGPQDYLIAAGDGYLSQPYGVGLDPAGEVLYIADTLNHCIRKLLIDP